MPDKMTPEQWIKELDTVCKSVEDAYRALTNHLKDIDLVDVSSEDGVKDLNVYRHGRLAVMQAEIEIMEITGET